MNKAYEKKLLAAFAKAGKNEKLLKDFLVEMLTDKEYAEMVRRFEILTRLAYGEPQRTIAEDLHLGIATVTRGSHVLSKSGNAFRKVTRIIKMIWTAIKMTLAIILGVIYLPLNLFLLKISDLYRERQKTNPIEYWAVRILIFPIWIVVAILSAPYELLVESAH